jgi:polysaccharide export outer membrane protein
LIFKSLPLAAFVLFLFFSACVPNRDLIYLQEKASSSSSLSETKEYNSQISAYKVQHGDVLNIRVMSQDPASVQPFNLDGQVGNIQMQLNLPQLYITGYTVNEEGKIDFPLVGLLEVRGKTIAEIGSLLENKIEKYVTNATVKVKLVSFKITVLGEVKTPGVHFIYNDRASLFEVLGFAGDLSDLANRHRVKLIRNVDKQVQITNIDLTERNLVESKAYFVLPNDVLYVEPMKAKNFRLNLPTINLILSSLTTILVVYNIVRQ